MSNRQKYFKEDVEQWYEYYKDASIPSTEIANMFDVNPHTMVKALRRYGYPIRNKGFQKNNAKGTYGHDTTRLKLLWFKRHTYMRRSKRKGITFNLSDDQFIALVTSNCHYCGKSHKEETRIIRKDTVNMLTIDRKNSSIGYIPDNCVPACKTCNTIKMDLPYDDFYEHIKKILQHRDNQ